MIESPGINGKKQVRQHRTAPAAFPGRKRTVPCGISLDEAAAELMWYQQARAASIDMIKMLEKMPPME